MKVGNVTQTDIGIMYIQGIADESIVKEVKERLKGIDIDTVLESNYIKELIRDDSATIFPLLLNTERPDAVVGNMLEGPSRHHYPRNSICFNRPGDFFSIFSISGGLLSKSIYQLYF
nr:spore germination protein [Peribacillus simplex]